VALEQLRGFSAPVKTWLQELLPPRLAPESLQADADSAATQAVLAQAFVALDLGWVGTGSERIALDYAENLRGHTAATSELTNLFVDRNARYAFTQLHDASNVGAEEFNTVLWQAAWQGQVTSDSLDTLALGNRADFKLSGHSSSRRARRVSWPGAWSLLEQQPLKPDPLETLETHKQNARVLLERYGVLCRELANREGEVYKWRNLFGALRVMELAGEVVSGAFFADFSGPQFATPAAVREFTVRWTPRDVFLSALDPISPSGMGLDWPTATLPHRRAGNHLVMVGGKLVAFSENQGSRLSFIDPPDSKTTAKACALLRGLKRTSTRIALKEINGEPARKSPYLRGLEQHFDVHSDHKGVYLET